MCSCMCVLVFECVMFWTYLLLWTDSWMERELCVFRGLEVAARQAGHVRPTSCVSYTWKHCIELILIYIKLTAAGFGFIVADVTTDCIRCHADQGGG
jgi:hypothetical protein